MFAAPEIRDYKFKRQFEFSENLEDIYGKCCWREGLALQQLFPYKSCHNFFLIFQIQTIIKSHSFMPEASNLATLIFSTCFSNSGIF